MDFTFSPEQELLRESVRSFLEKEASPAYVRAMVDDERGFTDEWWSAVTSLGWPGMLVPERHGGAGLGLVDLLVVQEEMGRLPLPGPFLSSCVAATLAAVRFDDVELQERLASGSRGTIALEEGGAGDPLESISAGARRAGGEWEKPC